VNKKFDEILLAIASREDVGQKVVSVMKSESIIMNKIHSLNCGKSYEASAYLPPMTEERLPYSDSL